MVLYTDVYGVTPLEGGRAEPRHGDRGPPTGPHTNTIH